MDEDDVASFFTGYVSEQENDSGSEDVPEPENKLSTFVINTNTPEDNLLTTVAETQSKASTSSSSSHVISTPKPKSSSEATSTSIPTSSASLVMPVTSTTSSSRPTNNTTSTATATTTNRPSDNRPNVAELPQPREVVFCMCQKQCHRQFEQHDLITNILNSADLTTPELDLCLIAKLQSVTVKLTQATSDNRKIPKERKRPVSKYLHEGLPICRDLFQRLHGIGKDRLDNLKRHAIQEGLTVRVKKSGGNNPKSVTYEQHVAIHSFLNNYAEEQGIKLPGRIPGRPDLLIYFFITGY